MEDGCVVSAVGDLAVLGESRRQAPQVLHGLRDHVVVKHGKLIVHVLHVTEVLVSSIMNLHNRR